MGLDLSVGAKRERKQAFLSTNADVGWKGEEVVIAGRRSGT